MGIVVKSKDKERMKDDILKSAKEVMKELEGVKATHMNHMIKSLALQEHARVLELNARVKQSWIYNFHTRISSMSPQQPWFHKQIIDEISQRLESEN